MNETIRISPPHFGHLCGAAKVTTTGKIWTNPIAEAYLNDKRQENKNQ
jgi:hypothetical protein